MRLRRQRKMRLGNDCLPLRTNLSPSNNRPLNVFFKKKKSEVPLNESRKSNF